MPDRIQQETPPSPTTTPTVSQVLNNGEEEQRSNEGFNLGQAIRSVWRGRLNRLGFIIGNICLYGAMNFLVNPMLSAESWAIFSTAWVLLTVFSVLQFGLYCSRLHDIGQPGYWAIPWFVSGAVHVWFAATWSMVVFLLILSPILFWPGEDGTNKWEASGIGIVKYCKRILGMQYS